MTKEEYGDFHKTLYSSVENQKLFFTDILRSLLLSEREGEGSSYSSTVIRKWSPESAGPLMWHY